MGGLPAARGHRHKRVRQDERSGAGPRAAPARRALVRRVVVGFGRFVRLRVTILGRPIEVAGRLIERGPASGVAIVIAGRLALADEPRQFGKRIVRLGARRRTGVATTVRAEIVVGHPMRPRFRRYAILSLCRNSVPTALAWLRTSRRKAQVSPHLVWRRDPEQVETRREYGGHALYKHKPGLGLLSIILDNEA